MGNPVLLCEVVKMRQKDIEIETALRQLAMQAQASRPGLIKRFNIVGESLLKKLIGWQKRKTLSPIERLFLNINNG